MIPYFLSMSLFKKPLAPPILNTVSLQAPSKIIRDHSIFTAVYCAKANHSARYISVANAVCIKINIFNHHGILLKK